MDQTQKVSIAPGANQAATFSVPVGKPGIYQGYVELSGEDGCPLDDRRWLAFEIDETYLIGSMYRFQEVNDIFPLRINGVPAIAETGQHPESAASSRTDASD